MAGGHERLPCEPRRIWDEARAADRALGLVDGVQHGRGEIDVDARPGARRGVGRGVLAGDGRAADVAAPVGRDARRLVRRSSRRSAARRQPSAVA